MEVSNGSDTSPLCLSLHLLALPLLVPVDLLYLLWRRFHVPLLLFRGINNQKCDGKTKKIRKPPKSDFDSNSCDS